MVGAGLTQLADRPEIQNQVAGVVLFGYSKAYEYHDEIPDFPPEKTRSYCDTGDEICRGRIRVVLPAHFNYLDDALIAAPIFLRGRVDVAKRKT